MNAADDQSARDAALRQAVEHMADQLCLAVDQRVDFVVRSPLADPTAEKLALLINFLLDSGGRLIEQVQKQADTLDRRVTERSALLQAVFDNVLDGLIVIDTTGKIRNANNAAHALFGHPQGALLNRRVNDLMPEPWRSAHDGYLQRYLTTRQPHVIGIGRDVRGLRRDGSTFPMRLAVSEVQVGDSHWFVGLVHDLSESEAQQIALREAKESAEAAALAKSQFLASMSHELRTPLNAIIGYAELIIEELDDGVPLTQSRNDLLAVRDSGRHLLRLINDVLDLSRVEAGHAQALVEAFDPVDLTRSVAATVGALVRQRSNRLVVDLPDALPNMHSDAGKIRQCLLNLLGNAAKFTENGDITLQLRPATMLDGAAALAWRVSDTGIGMSPEQCARVFEAFTQADASISRHYGGTGLGLTLSAALAALLGGSITVSSTLGQGSTFTLLLPLVVPQAGDAA